MLPKFVDIGDDAKKLREFKNLLLTRHTCSSFSSVQDLAVNVGIDLIRYLEPQVPESDDDPSQAFSREMPPLLQWEVFTRVNHEMTAPLSAIRNNLSRLRRRRAAMNADNVDRILEDMATDAEILRYQLQLLEYELEARAGRSAKHPLKTERVLLFPDVISKTINELKPMVRDQGLDPACITYDLTNMHKIGPVHIDRRKISQIIFNLFVNAVKYSEEPDTFRIHIAAEERKDRYVIKFRDWGIGVEEGFEDKIFDEGFRTAAAVQKVSGSGLGLTIARRLVREHGGDLVLKNRAKPTEFEILIPKNLPEAV